jgi:hypothetical protein
MAEEESGRAVETFLSMNFADNSQQEKRLGASKDPGLEA